MVQGTYWSPTRRLWDFQGLINGVYHSWHANGASGSGLKDYDLVEMIEDERQETVKKTVKLSHPGLNQGQPLVVQCERPELLTEYLFQDVVVETLK